MINRGPKRLLWRLLILSCGFFWAVSFLGPYQWKVYSLQGFLYYFMLYAAFFLGLISAFIVPSNTSEIRNPSLKSGQRTILFGSSLISVSSLIYELIVLFIFHPGDFNFLGGEAEAFSSARSALDQIALVLMQLGTASFILWSIYGCSNNTLSGKVVLASNWSSGIYHLCIGQRYVIAIEFVVYCTIKMLYTKRSIASRARKKWIIAILGLSIFIIFLYVFVNRVHTPILNKSELTPGDQPLKEWAMELYLSSNGSSFLEALYMLADYMGESPYVFSGFWEFFLPESPLWLLNEFRPIVQLLSLFGFPSYLEISSSIESLPKYTGIAWNLITDFGVYLAPLAAYLFGFVFSEIERFKDHSLLARALYPCCIGCVLFSPVYYFTVGRTDYTVYSILILYCLLLLFTTNRVGINVARK